MLQSSTETYPLTTIDLANLCPKPSGQRYRELREWQPPGHWVSYAPIKANWAKLLVREPSLPLDLERDAKETLLMSIARQCRYGERDVEANLAVGSAVWDWASENAVVSVGHSFDPYRTPLATNRFLEDGIVLMKDRGLAVFLDPRRSSTCLNKLGREFVFSANYWKLAGNDDYADVEIVILGLTDSKVARKVKLFEFDGAPLFGKDEIVERIDETQRIWLDVQLERRAAAARQG